VGKGKLLLCTMDLQNDLENRPVATQLKYSLIRYIQGDQFKPAINLSESALRKIISQ